MEQVAIRQMALVYAYQEGLEKGASKVARRAIGVINAKKFVTVRTVLNVIQFLDIAYALQDGAESNVIGLV